MVLLPINGIEVDFPFEPYGVQRQYMSRVISALRAGHNACLESPTGTGKSLALLCAALAWRQAYVAALQLLAHGGRDDKLFKSVGLTHMAPSGVVSSAVDESNSSSVADTIKSFVSPSSVPQTLRAPRIVFSSRTHSQLAQVINELKGTVYRPYMTVLGSRDQFCIHDISGRLSGAKLNQACRGLTATKRRGCQYHLAVASPRDHENRSKGLLQKLKEEAPKDIEDLVDFGRLEGACPWYLSRAAASSGEVEILFIPYNYLIDRSTRESLDIDWTNDVIIVDEAHNLENICADAISFDLTSALRAGCKQELAKCIDRAMRPGGLHIPALEELAKSDDGTSKLIGSENRDALEYRLLQTMLLNFEDSIAQIQISGKDADLEHDGPKFSSFPGSYLRELFTKAHGASEESTSLILEVLERAADVPGTEDTSGNVDDQRTDRMQSRSSSGQSFLRSLHNAIRILFDPAYSKYQDSFRTVIHSPDSNSSTAGRTISYWCFNPAVAMADVMDLGVRSLILTSGTLSPMESFSSELGIEFSVRLENRHVVGKDQVFGGILCAGPDGTRLSSGFHTRESDTYKLSLGRTIIEVAGVVPDGILVFFPSYRVMDSCVQFWRAVGLGELGQKPSIYELILRRKRVIVEPRDSGQFAAAILAHQTNIQGGHGSVMLAVCRGKVSEGIDFSDAYGRAVLIAGIPFPAAMDPKVILKREHVSSRHHRQNSSSLVHRESTSADAEPSSGTSIVAGEEWYTRQAVRAINQAIGRVIRHKHDYGAVLLCDERFSASHIQSQLSKWLRPYMNPVSTYESTLEALQKFFAVATQSSFCRARKSTSGAADSTSACDRAVASKGLKAFGANTHWLESYDAANAVDAAAQAIAQFMPPPKSREVMQAELDRISTEIRASRPSCKPEDSTVKNTGDLVTLLGSRPSDAMARPKNVSEFQDHSQSKVSHGNNSLQVSRSQKRTEAFLERRSSTKLSKRGLVKHSNHILSYYQGEKRLKLSEEAKSLLCTAKNFRDVLGRLRTIMTLAAHFADDKREEHRLLGNEEVSKLVHQIKASCGSSCSDRVEAFLDRLREKIPVPFKEAYTSAVDACAVASGDS